MSPRISAALATLALLLPVSAAAQSAQGEVTLMVPLKLTQVSPDIEKVAVWCQLSSPAITNADPRQGYLSKQVELPVSSGTVTMTAALVFSVSVSNPTGQTASYNCRLSGYSRLTQRWDTFSDSKADVAFRLSPTPAVLGGSFAW